MEQTALNALLDTNAAASAKAKSSTVDAVILSVTDWKPTKGGLAVKMVKATIDGKPVTFWPLASSISNLPSSFNKPVPAKAVLTPSSDGKFLNMSRLEFSGLASESLLAIREMKVGTALFASAAGIALN